jgi:hypothetical protein
MSSENDNEIVEYEEGEDNESSIKIFFAKVFTFILTVYMYSWFVAVPWMNWNYARDNGFWKWLLFGEIVATGKGMVWPYYAYKKYTKKADVKQAENPFSEQTQWDQYTEMLAYTITGSWTIMEEPDHAEQLLQMIHLQKEWIATLPSDKKANLLKAAKAYEAAWLELGKNVTMNPKGLFDGTCYDSPLIEKYKSEFKHVTGIRNAWDRSQRDQAIKAATAQTKADMSKLSDEQKEKMYASMSLAFGVLMKQGKERMDETIQKVFNL